MNLASLVVGRIGDCHGEEAWPGGSVCACSCTLVCARAYAHAPVHLHSSIFKSISCNLNTGKGHVEARGSVAMSAWFP